MPHHPKNNGDDGTRAREPLIRLVPTQEARGIPKIPAFPKAMPHHPKNNGDDGTRARVPPTRLTPMHEAR